MLETYRGIPHLLDTWLVLTGMALPIALSSLRRPGELVPRLAAFCVPPAFALVLAATLSPTALRLGVIGQCGTHLTTTGGLTSIQGALNVVLFVPAAGMLTLASGRPADGIAAGIGLSAAVEAVQALIPQLGRSCQLHDLIANTLGAFAGVGLAAGLQTITRARHLVAPAYVVEHAALLVVQAGRRSARHRRGQLMPRPVPRPVPVPVARSSTPIAREPGW
ncbi:VanZ like protein [Kribbella antiqua]|uniref:VanZ like protein n=1 Tax=Kribbella antiqua TaxID=2512217 RepID=A0A4R2IMY7_9ACTN|nr:VanZ family protein [Kribbella antiqua]TCO46167.1 VanZ like protein [Kribbella antiqua]